jgi:iron complex outermembrane receptor protein
MSKLLNLGCIIFVLLFVSGSLLAQSETVDTEDVELREIDVRGAVRREELQSTSATVLENKDVQERIFYQPLDIVEMSPGVSIIQYGEAGMSPQFQMRGFTARQDTGMYLDGIPLVDNGHAAGFMDSTIVMPIEIESVEIIKGPSSVYYGQRAAGGSIPIQSIKRGNHKKLNLRYGSWADANATGLFGWDNGKFAQIYAFELYHSDGYRDNSTWDRRNFSGRWTYDFTDQFSASFNIRAYNAEWDSAGYTSHKLQGPKDAVDDGSGEGNGGQRDRYDARLWANYLINNDSQLTFYAHGTMMEFTRYQRGARTMDNILAGTFPDMTEQYNRHNAWGTGLTYNYKGTLGGKEATFTAGFTYTKEMDVPRSTYTIPWGMGRKRVAPAATDVSFTLDNPSILAEVTYQVHDQINLRIGSRYDWLKGHLENNKNGAEASKSYTFVSPKAGILVM